MARSMRFLSGGDDVESTPGSDGVQPPVGEAGETVEGVFDRHYQDLRAIALSWMRHEREDHTLQATAVVHEAYLRLRRSPPPPKMPELYYLAAISRCMRQVLIAHARAHVSGKRTPPGRRVGYEGVAGVEGGYEQLLQFDEALTGLRGVHDRSAQVVELRVFGGMTNQAVASWLGVSARTAQVDWRFAKSWLHHRMGQSV